MTQGCSARTLLGITLAAVMACAGRRPMALSGPPWPCTPGTHGGLASAALAWGDRGWAALTTYHGAVVLREYTPDGDAREEPVELTAEPTPDSRLALAWSAGAWVATVAPRNAAARVVHWVPGGTPTVSALGARVTGDVSMVPRPSGLAVFYATGEGPRMVLVGDTPGTPQVCPDNLEPRAVTASGDRFVALVPVVDGATGDGVGLDVLTLDGGCAEVTRAHLWQGAPNGRGHAVAADGHGRVYAAFGDRDGAMWVAVVTDDGSVRSRPRRLLAGGASPRVVADDTGADVLAVRTDEAADNLVVTRVDTEGLLQRTQSVASAPTVVLLALAADPWGGSLVGWTRPDPTGGAARTGTGQYSFVTRVCPARR